MTTTQTLVRSASAPSAAPAAANVAVAAPPSRKRKHLLLADDDEEEEEHLQHLIDSIEDDDEAELQLLARAPSPPRMPIDPLAGLRRRNVLGLLNAVRGGGLPFASQQLNRLQQQRQERACLLYTSPSPRD